MTERRFRLPTPPRALIGSLLALVVFVALFLRTYQLTRFPPGPYYDEAASVILAGEVSTGSTLPLFIQAYTGHEVLYYYIAAAVMRLLGVSYFALRLSSALAGVATVLLCYLLARELFDDEPIVEPHWLGLFAAAWMATSFWHVSVSRYGLRAITLPLVQSAMLLALWRGLRRDSWRWIVAAGVLCGLVAYTYLSSRIVPLALALVGLAILVAERPRWRWRLAQLGVFTLVALLVFAPLGIFFLTHPDTFAVRMSQVSIAPEGGLGLATLGRSALRALELFTLRGDPLWRYNNPGMPMFQGLLAGLFYAGLLLVAVRLVRPSGFLGRVRYGLLIVWPLVMLVPTILADPWEVPHSLRAIGIMPVIFVVPALGVLAVAGLAARAMHLGYVSVWGQAPHDQARYFCRRLTTALIALLFVADLVVSGAGTFREYFWRWGPDPHVYYDDQGDIADMARYLDALPDEARTLYVSSPDYRPPTVAALAHNYDQMKWLQGNLLFVFSPGPALYAWPHASLPDDFWLAGFFQPESLRAQELGPDGAPAYVVYTLDSLPALSPTHPLSANFGGIVEAIGYDVLRDRPSGGKTDVAVYWRILRSPERGDYSQFVRLNDAWGVEWGQGGSFAYPSEQWTPGEVIVERVRVQTTDGTPPGQYMLKIGWWSASSGERLPVIDQDSGFAGTTVAVGPITVTRRIRPLDLNALPLSHRSGARLGSLTLVGFDQWPGTLMQGETEWLSLYWQALETPLPRPDHSVTLQMRAVQYPQQVTVLSRDGAVHGTYPTSQWEAGELVAERLALRVPPTTPPGQYVLEVQVDEQPAQALDRFEVQAVARTWAPPAISHPLSVTLGSQIALVGYTIDSATALPGQSVTLTLVWQSLAGTGENYTVFVHVLDASGALRSQADAMPVSGAYPTALWQPGEFVVDTLVIPLPPDLPGGEYSLQAGMYLAESGERLTVTGDGDHVGLGKIGVAP